MTRPKRLPAVPPLPRLAAKKKLGGGSTNPCAAIMVSMLGCWASNGDGAEACKHLENDLKACMKRPIRPLTDSVSDFNKNATRLLPQIHEVRRR